MPFYPALGDEFESVETWTTHCPYKSRSEVLDRPLPARPFSKSWIFADKGLVFAILRSKRKITDAFAEPAILSASTQMKFKESGDDLVLYEPKRPPRR